MLSKRTWPCLMTVVACTGCATDTLFHDDFHADIAGNAPSDDPAGSPSGDIFYLSGSGTQSAEVIDTPAMGGKCMQYSNADVPVILRYAVCFSEVTPLAADQAFRAEWTGIINLDDQGSGLEVSLGDNHYSYMAVVRFKGGAVKAKTADSPEAWTTIGNYTENEKHYGLIEVNKAAAKYSVTIVPGGIASGWLDVLSTTAMQTSQPSLYFQYYEDKSGSGKYLLDDLLISKVDL